MYFYFIVFLSILIPFVSKNKKWGIRISFFLLFILLGFQYQLVNDWGPNIGRWYYANEGASEDATASSLEMGPVFLWLLKFFKPITFFGWLMLTAATFLFIIYKYVRKYVPQKYYWVSVFVLMLDVSYAPLIINSNRQCTSLIFVLIGVWIMMEFDTLKIKLPFFKNSAKYLITCTLFFIAAKCHSVAYVSILLIPIYLISKRFKGYNWVLMAIIGIGILLARTIIDVTWLQGLSLYLANYLNIGDVSLYMEWLDTDTGGNSILYIFIYSIIILVVCYYYRFLTDRLKFFALAWYVGFIIASYFTGNVNRIGEYFYIFFLFLIPNIADMVMKSKVHTIMTLRVFVIFILLGYGIAHSWTQMHTEYEERWLDYKSVFEAPQWE